jgi:guanylate kinase
MSSRPANGRLLMIAAPSGAGKSSLINAFLSKHPDWLLSISTTTRPPRPGEVHGREYFFTDRSTFVKERDQGAFLEWAEVHGNFYGTSKPWVEARLMEQQNILLEIDWQGAQQIRRIFAETAVKPKSVFIMPPSVEELERRLRARGQDSEAVIQARLAAAHDEISHSEEFDYVIINQDFSAALHSLESIAASLLHNP